MGGMESRSIGVSIKDRSAVLPVGHMADGAYWYDPDSNHWVTSTYYTADLPNWVRKLNSEAGYQRYLGAKWLPVDAKGETDGEAVLQYGSRHRRHSLLRLAWRLRRGEMK